MPPSQQQQQQPQQQRSNVSSSPDAVRASPSSKTVSLRVPPLLQRSLPSGEAASASFVAEALRCFNVEPPQQLLKSRGRQVVYVAAEAAADCSAGFGAAPTADTPRLQRHAAHSGQPSRAPPPHAPGSLLSSPALVARAQAAAAAALAAATSAQRLADQVAAASGLSDDGSPDEDSPAAAALALAARAHAAAQEACYQAELVRSYERPSSPPLAGAAPAGAWSREALAAERTVQEADYRGRLLDVLDHLAGRPPTDGSPTAGLRGLEHDGHFTTAATTRLLRAVRHIKMASRDAGAFAGLGATCAELTALLLRSSRCLFRSRRDGAEEARLLAGQLRADAQSSADAAQHSLAAVEADALRQLLLSFTMQALLVKPDIGHRQPAGQQQCSPRAPSCRTAPSASAAGAPSMVVVPVVREASSLSRSQTAARSFTRPAS